MENNHEIFNLLNQIREAQERSSSQDTPSLQKYTSQPPTSQESSQDHNTYSTTSQPRQPPPPNPAEISTYSNAVKYVARYISHDEQILSRIRLLLEDQDRHEKEWFETRESIIHRQENRRSGQEELDNILKMVGGAGNTAKESPSSSLQSNIRELEAHDLKVYKSALKLIDNHREQLSELHIPLFCRNSPPSSNEDKQKLLDFLKDIAT